MIEAAEAAGDREGVLQGRNWRVVDLMELGERDALEREIAAYEELADAVGLAHYRWYVPLWRAALAQLEGRWADAEALGREALALADRAGDQMAPWLVRVAARVHARGPGPLAPRSTATSSSSRRRPRRSRGPGCRTSPTSTPRPATRTARGEALRELVADGGAKLPRGLNWHVLAYVAEAAARLGDREAAELLYATLEPHARLFPVVARGGVCLGSVQYSLARPGARARTARRGRAAPAPRDHREPADRRPPARDDRAGRLGELLLERGETERGRETLREAAAQADELDMPGVASRARAAARGGLAVAA